jgi:hypothetical protein
MDEEPRSMWQAIEAAHAALHSSPLKGESTRPHLARLASLWERAPRVARR